MKWLLALGVLVLSSPEVSPSLLFEVDKGRQSKFPESNWLRIPFFLRDGSSLLAAMATDFLSKVDDLFNNVVAVDAISKFRSLAFGCHNLISWRIKLVPAIHSCNNALSTALCVAPSATMSRVSVHNMPSKILKSNNSRKY